MLNILGTDSNKIIQPESIKINLMEHQKTAIYAMLNLEKTGIINTSQLLFYYNQPKNFKLKTTMGILGDIVGSGKSLIIISLITESIVPTDKVIIVDSSPNILVELQDDEYDKANTNLIIVPDHLLDQWTHFFTLSSLKLIVIKNKPEYSLDELKTNDVILIGCKVLPIFLEKYNKIKWARIVVDEADTIKISKKIDLNARFVWLITGTPTGLRHASCSNLTTKLVGNLKGWIYPYITIKNDDEFVKQSLKLQPPKKYIINCLTPNEINILKDIIPKSTIAMINAGNLSQAIRSLNCNEDTTENILQVVTKNIQTAIKNKKLEFESEKKKEYKGNLKIEQDNKIKKIENILNRLCDRLNSIRTNMMSLNQQYCPVCMDEFTKPTIVNCCHTVFCFQCIILCMETAEKCPHCMKVLNKKQLNVIKNKNEIEIEDNVNNNIIQHKKKEDALIDIIKNNIKGKYLIFSNYEGTFDLIQKKLKQEQISYGLLTNSINETVDKFKNDDMTVLMLNATFFGAGLNLQFASDVIMFHRFTKEMEEQVIGRAQRIGRTSQLNVHYLLHDNESNNVMDEDVALACEYHMEYLEN